MGELGEVLGCGFGGVRWGQGAEVRVGFEVQGELRNGGLGCEWGPVVGDRGDEEIPGCAGWKLLVRVGVCGGLGCHWGLGVEGVNAGVEVRLWGGDLGCGQGLGPGVKAWGASRGLGHGSVLQAWIESLGCG